MTKNWIRYWRNSLADGERMERDVQKLEHYQLESLDLSKGRLPVDKTVKLVDGYEKKVNRQRGAESPEDEDWLDINQIPLVIAPFAVLPVYEHAKRVTETNKVYPFWINAVADRSGLLLLPEIKFPVFVRRSLDPAVKEDQQLSLSSIDQVDNIMSEGVPDIESWDDYWNFVTSFFKKVTNKELDDFSLDKLIVKEEFVIAVDDAIEGAGDGIIKLYDHLAALDEHTALLVNLSNIHGNSVQPLIQEKEWINHLSGHLGQMGDKFPLSFTQRQSVIHYTKLGHGEALAVNGPPGTGKTTLLQSIVAHEFVRAAIDGNDPFVMVASSTNNQAVTNIIDSFSKADSTYELLAERWLPEINSYALYLPSSSVEPKKGVHYARSNGEGLPSLIENPDYLEKATDHFLGKMGVWMQNTVDEVSAAVDELRAAIKKITLDIEKVKSGWQEFLGIKNLLIAYAGKEKLKKYFSENTLDKDQIDIELKELERLREEFYNIKQSESFWLVLFSFLKFFKEKRAIPYKRLFQSSSLDIQGLDFYKVNQIEELLTQKIETLNKVNQTSEKWTSLKNAHDLKSNPPAIFDEIDQKMRHEAFLLATHYWEGRWLLETKNAIAEDVLRKVGEPNMKRKFRRYAMLCPCFVATFYMLPKFFIYKKYGGGTYPEFPLLDFIDLLIVDEAGQVTPDVGAASFALAKKAIIVGDIKQIDPIWKIPKPIDYSNLDKFNLIDNGLTLEEMDTRGFTASAGSVMRLAQNASYYHAAEQEAKGMMLVEHRRCFNEIIDYCNDLAYHGLLRPLRGKLSKQEMVFPLPALGMVDISGESRRENGSRLNEEEAIGIANWLIENRDKIEQFYLKPKKKFEDHVGIITPFTAQKQLLKRVLKKAGFDTKRLTVGTVHALQGAERPIILFSPVYASNETSRSFFFDRGVNMLNVAVSRAKDSFLLFGDIAVFNEKAQSPSGMLIRHLRNKGVEV